MLKDNAYVSVEEAGTWLKVKGTKIGLSDVAAELIVQDLTYTAVELGLNGNDVSIEYLAGGTAGSEVVTVVNQKVSVQIEDGVSTASQIKSKVQASSEASELVEVDLTGVGSNAQIAAAEVQLAGGAHHAEYDSALVAMLEIIINTACTKSESIIKTSVLAKDFQETLDGSNSNVLIPAHWPIVQVNEIKIDTLRQFDPSTALDSVNYFLRGQSDKRQASTDLQIRLVGQDVVIRDDNEKYILGRVFSGSSLGSVQIKYKAGWALDSDDVPSDIRMATLLLVEFWYMQRDNRDLNVQSKGVKGESYTKVEKGIPEQVYDLLQPYEDISFGTHQMPQRNTFKI